MRGDIGRIEEERDSLVAQVEAAAAQATAADLRATAAQVELEKMRLAHPAARLWIGASHIAIMCAVAQCVLAVWYSHTGGNALGAPTS